MQGHSSVKWTGFVAAAMLVLTYCKPKSDSVPGLPKSKSLSETGLRAWNQKRELDKLLKSSKRKVIVYVQKTGEDSVRLIRDGNFPDSIQTTYNLLIDNNGRLRLASEFPFSESGDWSIRLTHYFDTSGKTFAFERHANFFNSVCTQDMATEIRHLLYDTGGRMTDSLYILQDKEQKDLSRETCQFPYDYPYTVASNATEWQASKRLNR